MIEVSWLLFVITSLVLIATPGQDMILVMSRSIAQGPAAGVATAAGVSLGLVGHTILATLGLGAILRTSEWLFSALKFFGAAYLIYLGVGLLVAKHHELALASAARRSHARLFFDGAVSNVSNPKIAIFYFAFLPQFVSPAALYPTLSIFALGLAFAALTFLIKAPIGISAGALSGWLRARPAALRWLFRSSGAILIGLGVRLALERRQ
jgi:threonine/homoserine/homoserine lactone efflux protein